VTAAVAPLYRVLARALDGLRVQHVFGVMGEDTASLTVGIIEQGIAYHGARHESAAVAMADGYSWASQDLGVCMVTRGPGLMNAATACRTAVQGGRRVLLITGDAPVGADHRFDYKYIDQAPISAALGLAHFAAASPEKAMVGLEQAVESAQHGRPAVLAIPANVFGLELGLQTPVRAAPVATNAPQPPDDGAIAGLSEMIAESRRPLILAGRGAASSEAAPALGRLAERIGALLGTTLLAKDLFRGHRLDLGVVGSFASDAAADLLAEVDLVLAFGASLTPFTTAQRTLFAGAEVVQIDSDGSRLGASFAVSVGVPADARLTAERLLERVESEGSEGSRAEPRFDTPEALARLSRPLYGGPDESGPGELDPRMVAVTLDRTLPEDRVIVLDSGRFMTSPARFIRVPGPGSFRLTADAGSIAIGLGIALGAAVARPKAANVLFVGDGGLSMSMGDLETAARNAVALIVVVMNDRAYGAEYVHLQADGLPADYAALPEIDFAGVARALGIEALTVSSMSELEAVAPRLRGRSGPLLIDCRIRQDITVERLRWPEKADGLAASPSRATIRPNVRLVRS
jgi:acetolactate synthase I/II/III large subunit